MVLFYSTFPNLISAQKTAQLLVEKKMAACVNILPKMISIYSWNNKISRESEVVVLIKTSSKNFSKIERLFQKTHPYEVFCLLELPMKKISKSYSKWLHKNLV